MGFVKPTCSSQVISKKLLSATSVFISSAVYCQDSVHYNRAVKRQIIIGDLDMKDFKCGVCGKNTEKIWENKDKTVYGMKCTSGHKNKDGKDEYPTFLVSAEKLET